MINLFERDCALEKDEKLNKIKKYFYRRYTEGVPEDKKLQININEAQSLMMYQNIRLNPENKDYLSKINDWYSKYKRKFDVPKETFLYTFPDQFWQNCFELAMVDLVSGKYQLEECGDAPDIKFAGYFIECTTRSTSMMDKFDAAVVDFNNFLQVCQLLFNWYQNLKKEYPSVCNLWYLDSSIAFVWETLEVEEKYCLKTKLMEDLSAKDEVVIDKINNLIYWYRYALIYFKDFLPSEMVAELEKIKFPIGSIENEPLPNFQFLIMDLIRNLCVKLKKDYFQSDKLGTVAISLAMFNPGIKLIPLSLFVSYFRREFFNKFEYFINKQPDENKKKILRGLNNLYAIIIDTHWYNWFPDIVEKQHGAQFGEHKNNYLVIYNSKLVSDKGMYDSLVKYACKMPLNHFD